MRFANKKDWPLGPTAQQWSGHGSRQFAYEGGELATTAEWAFMHRLWKLPRGTNGRSIAWRWTLRFAGSIRRPPLSIPPKSSPPGNGSSTLVLMRINLVFLLRRGPVFSQPATATESSAHLVGQIRFVHGVDESREKSGRERRCPLRVVARSSL